MTFPPKYSHPDDQAGRVFWKWQFLERVPTVGLKNANNQVVTNV